MLEAAGASDYFYANWTTEHLLSIVLSPLVSYGAPSMAHINEDSQGRSGPVTAPEAAPVSKASTPATCHQCASKRHVVKLRPSC